MNINFKTNRNFRATGVLIATFAMLGTAACGGAAELAESQPTTIAPSEQDISDAAEADNMEELTYEGYAPGGVALLVEVMTDNRNRTVAEVRHAFTKLGGNLGTDGSVAYLFSRTGLIQFESSVDEEAVMEVALDAGAEDIVTRDDGSIDVMTAWEEVTEVRDALVAAGLEPVQAEVTMFPSTEVELDAGTAPSVVSLIDMLEDLDDVQNVYSNADIPDAVLAVL